jgi:hypothetical protein
MQQLVQVRFRFCVFPGAQEKLPLLQEGFRVSWVLGQSSAQNLMCLRYSICCLIGRNQAGARHPVAGILTGQILKFFDRLVPPPLPEQEGRMDGLEHLVR